MNKPLELRTYDVSLSEVESSDGLFRVRGIVNRPNTWSNKLSGKNGKPFIERILPEAFTNAIKQNPNIKFLAQHDKNLMLASTKAGSLNLEVANDGLVMEARIAPSDLGQHFYTLIKTGEMSEMSLGMYVLKDEWETSSDIAKRTITDLYLTEVSAVTDGAHVQTSIEVRSAEVDVPNIEERNFEIMTKKQLEERQQELLAEVETIDNALNLEKRSANTDEELRKKVILNEINQIDEQLEKFVEQTKTYVKEERNMNKIDVLQDEKRGMEQFLKNQDGEELRAMTTTSNTGGGTTNVTIPTNLSKYIVEKLNENAPLFSRTKQFSPVNGFLEVLREESFGGAQFVPEGQSAQLSDFTMDKIRLDQKRIATGIELSNHFINDAGIDVVDYVAKTLAKRIALKADTAIILGDKDNGEFEGILPDPGNSIETLQTAGVGVISIDDLLDLQNAMHPDLQGEAVYVVSRSVFNAIAKLKDGNGHYYMVRDVVDNGVTYKLFGQPVIINDIMPPAEAGMKAVIFANFGEGYATMVKQGFDFHRISNDTQNALKGTNTFVANIYADGRVLNLQALKMLQIKEA